MEVFRGSPQDQDFQDWFQRLRRNKRGNIVAVAPDAIPCHQVREILENTPDLDEEKLKALLIHVAVCWGPECKEIRHQLIRKKLKIS